ncbi:ABC transporter substrate-binding protein [Psychrosphaera ytuae]|uniref:ABC transporter substrate-binding protein n=1 Tax=Psychrosphaera ytuae TaxID=2820710 RepID=A0A975HIB6_9GAMM|nr:ABC transporter substrate-binding protein [Psychrosphaera ytuae]QTH64065.1 ABC transporter substrate-binding protein [Psychrosphaera ytuae]
MLRVSVALASLLLLVPSYAVSLDNDKELALKYQQQIEQIELTNSPYVIVEDLAKVVFKSVADAKSLADKEQEKQRMKMIVEEQLIPFVDIRFASYKILGPQLKQSTREERDLFVDAMRKILVETYSSALIQYNNQKINYEQERDVSGKKTVAIRTELEQPGAKPLSMVFKLRKNTKTNEWRAYDLVVEGISLVDAKRAELSKPLRDKGIGDVANELLKS